MNTTFYLTTRRKTYFVRRRVPRLSPENRPVMISLGTTDRKIALRSCVKLTARMDRMLDENLHISLPEADVTAFFSAELRSYLRGLEVTRRIEHVDGSMTEHKARQNQLTTVILNNMAEGGLRAEIPQARLTAIPLEFRDEAAALHHDMYKEFLSSEFNADIQQRATAQLGCPSLTNCDQLLLRKAALDARMAAHSALEAASSQSASQGPCAALELLSETPSSRPPAPDPDPANGTVQPSATPAIDKPKAKQCLSEGVDLIDRRVTALAIYHQRDQALNQPASPNCRQPNKGSRVGRGPLWHSSSHDQTIKVERRHTPPATKVCELVHLYHWRADRN